MTAARRSAYWTSDGRGIPRNVVYAYDAEGPVVLFKDHVAAEKAAYQRGVQDFARRMLLAVPEQARGTVVAVCSEVGVALPDEKGARA